MRDHLYCFKKYGGARAVFLNMAVREITPDIVKKDFDLILFHNMFLSRRWRPEQFRGLLEKIAPLKNSKAVKAALLQDEYFRADDFNAFINDFAINHVFTTARVAEWSRIFNAVDFNRVAFHKVLTGYLDDDRVRALQGRGFGVRPVDIAYRATRAPACWGRHGYLKFELGETFGREAPRFGIKTDISTKPEDIVLGDAWYEFLLQSKYTISVEGGTSVADRDGEIERKTYAYVKAHPQAAFEEIEKNCFPGEEGSIHSYPMSPRHLEACLTRTCQILVEGEYDGVLKPNEHYIPLKRDFSNLADVLAEVKRDGRRAELVENAYCDIVASGRYSYRTFVDFVFNECLKGRGKTASERGLSAVYVRWMDFLDWLSWRRVAWEWRQVKRQRARESLK